MKKIIFGILIALFLISCGSDTPLSPPEPPPELTLDDLEFGAGHTFDIMTWNVEDYAKKGATTIEYVTQIVEALEMDVIALQEIRFYDHFTTLTTNLEGWEGYRTGSPASTSQRLAYLVNSETVEVLEDPYEIYQDQSYYFPRRPYVLEISYDDTEFIIINNHLKAFGDPESVERRRQACILLESYISTHHLDNNVILLGDLNDSLTNPPHTNVFQVFLDQPEHYYFVDMDIAESPPYYWSYPTWPSHLDHIMITSSLFNAFGHHKSIVETILLEKYLIGGWQTYEEYVSDHRPVALKLMLD